MTAKLAVELDLAGLVEQRGHIEATIAHGSRPCVGLKSLAGRGEVCGKKTGYYEESAKGGPERTRHVMTPSRLWREAAVSLKPANRP